MEKLRAKLVAYSSTDMQLFSKAKQKLTKLLHKDKVEFVDKDPDILVFLTGGSEAIALQSVREYGFYLLIASADDNSWAAATEVKAWMNQNNISSILLDKDNPKSAETVDAFHMAKHAVGRLRGQKFGMVGKPSEWLVNSTINPFIIETKLGVEQVNIGRESIDINGQKSIAPDFISTFNHADTAAVIQSGKVYEALSKLIKNLGLNAITVECFSMIESCNATACLALAKLSADGIPAGCEGDITAITGMMLLKELTGMVPWMTNVAHVSREKVLLTHCTVPTNLLKDFSLDTHFETGKGLAIDGEIDAHEVTLFRFNNTLTKAFVGTGRLVTEPKKKSVCRTQVVLEIGEKVSDYFLNNPLGNHHLVIPGNYTTALRLALNVLKINVV